MAEGTVPDFNTFVQLHQPQFQSIGLPNHLWEKLYDKIFPELVHDTVNAFEVRKSNDNSGWKWSLHAKSKLKKESNVYILEHVWTSDGGKEAHKKLQKDSKLFIRMKDMVFQEEAVDTGGDFIDSKKVVSMVANVDENVAEDALKHTKEDLIEALYIIRDGKVDLTPQTAMQKMVEEQIDKKVLTLEEFKMGLLNHYKEEDISDEYIKRLYKDYVKDCESDAAEKEKEKNGGTTLHYTWTEDVEGTITAYVSIPQKTKKEDIYNHIGVQSWEFGVKGSPPVVKGQFFSRVHPDECFWTFDSPGLMQVLIQKADPEVSWPDLIKGEEQLSTRNIEAKANSKEQEVVYEMEQILESMWRYNQTYQAYRPATGLKESVWYVMDEYGSAVNHSVQPNLRCMPFASVTSGTFYSVIWPIKDIEKGEICTRNACPQMSSETSSQHQARQLAFEPDLPERCPIELMLSSVELDKSCANVPLPSLCIQPLENKNDTELDGDLKSVKFYTDLQTDFFISCLKDIGCSLVSSPAEADVLWLGSGSAVLEGAGDKKVNRLRGEESLLQKNILSYLVRMTCGKPSWFPTTYDLKTQLAPLVADHYERGINNYWVARSFNRKMNEFVPFVTSSLSRLCRLSEMAPLVASHYEAASALYNLKRRFCLQFSVVVSSSSPMEIFMHNDPLVKITSKEMRPFEKVDEYDSSGVVAVVQEKVKPVVTLNDLLENLKKNYFLKHETTWESVRGKIGEVIGELFQVVSPTVAPYPSSCAVYGVDVILSHNLQPIVIGVDDVPKCASKEILRDVLLLAFCTGENKEKLKCARKFTKISC